jgi:periplasmic protein TonB
VTVSCTIQTDGRPADCKVLSSQGGAAFAAATLRWLSSPSVRYSPAIRNGQPVSEEHVWVVKYQVD